MTQIALLKELNRAALVGERREDEESLASIETSLNVALPVDVRWFMKNCGYGSVHAVPNLQTSIKDTQRFRKAVHLPQHFVVLEDRNDAGVVLLDTSSPEGRVLWVDYYALPALAAGAIDTKNQDCFDSFSAWVAFCIEDENDAAAI